MHRTVFRSRQSRFFAAALRIIAARMAGGATATRVVDATIVPRVHADLTTAPDGQANLVKVAHRAAGGATLCTPAS